MIERERSTHQGETGGHIRVRILTFALFALSLASCGLVGGDAPKSESVVDGDRTSPAEPATTSTFEAPAPPEAEGLFALGYRNLDPIEWLTESGLIQDPAPPVPPPPAAEGDEAAFTVARGIDFTTVAATMRYANDAVTMWVEEGVTVSDRALAAAADRFAREVIPPLTAIWGPLIDPGVDGDPRLAILHAATLEGAAGEFVAHDLLPASAFEGSNEREMIYVGVDNLEVGSDFYLATLAHEFQHLLDYQLSGNTPLWMAEGMAQVAERIAGFDQVIADDDYLSNLAIPLNDWNVLQLDDRHYGGSYLFLTYVYERFGRESMRGLVESPLTGMAAVHRLAQENGTDLASLVGDWVSAMALDDASVGDGHFIFESDDLGRACPVIIPDVTPYRHNQTVRQFAPRYYEVTGTGPITVEFDGNATIGVIPDLPFRGEHLWWSGRADSSVSSMTRAFDLSGVSAATLEFRTWFDTGLDDGGLVKASTDGGATWTILSGRRAEDFGAGTGFLFSGYTGTSGSSTDSAWIRDEIDLREYVGEPEVLIRFEYLTDLFEGRIGWAIDNIEIASIGYSDGGENGNDWELDGFTHTDNREPQPWSVRVIQPDGDEPVRAVPLTDGQGAITIDGEGGPATVAVVAVAPGVGTSADFTVEVQGILSFEDPDVTIDDFSRPCSGWEEEETDDYKIQVADGQLTMTIFEEEMFTWSAREGFHEDVALTTTATFQNDEVMLAGLMCRLNSNGFYDFEISSDGFFFGGVAHPDGYDTLVDWTESPVINQGAGAVNEMTLRCAGSTIEFIVNGTSLASVTDDRVRAGQVAVAGGTFDSLGDDAIVHFEPVDITPTPLAELDGVIYAEDFAAGAGDWEVYASARGAASHEDGAYRLEVRGSGWAGEGFLETSHDDVIVDAAIRINELPPEAIFGLTCRTNEIGEQYLFLASADGFFTVLTYLGDDFFDVVPWTILPSVDTQPGAVNHLHVQCIGDRLVFEVNGLRVADVIDDRVIGNGQISLIGFTFERGGLSIDLLDVVLRRP